MILGGWIVFGFLTSLITSITLRRHENPGLFTDILFGITGSIIGDLLLGIFVPANAGLFTGLSQITAIVFSFLGVLFGRLVYK